MKALLACLVGLVLHSSPLLASVYYVSPTGSDTGPGTFDAPFRTIPRAASAMVEGDTTYVRGGTHTYSTTITLPNVGIASQFCLLAYPGERPFLDCSSMPIENPYRGITLTGSRWYIKGLDIWRAGDNGMYVSGSFNVIDFCTFSENSDTGLQLGMGASWNVIRNCDSFNNADPGQGNADGFAPKLEVGTGNYFYGCRAWQNSDDGWDGYIRPAPPATPTTTIENCWSFANGYLKTGAPSTGNGNGFKMGGSDNKDLSHNMVLKNCFSSYNRVKGFDQNNNHGSMTMLNCTAFGNGVNFRVAGPIDPGSVITVKNCVSMGAGAVQLAADAVQVCNSWMAPFVATIDDFASTDTTGMRAPRDADGNLPAILCMNLAPGSDLIDAGVILGLGMRYHGAAPDLGCFESDAVVTGVPDQAPQASLQFVALANPADGESKLRIRLPYPAYTVAQVFDVHGRRVRTLVNGELPAGEHVVTWDGRDEAGRRVAGGVYLGRLDSGGAGAITKICRVR